MALAATAALVNTEQDDADELATGAALDEFIAAWQWTGSRRHDEAELREVQALRPRLRALWHADEAEAAALVNGLLREFHALPQLVRHDEFDYHIHATGPEA